MKLHRTNRQSFREQGDGHKASVSQVIRDWIADFDSVIDRVAIDPREVKQDMFLRHAFLQAFFPENLPPTLSFEYRESTDELEFEKQAHRPYYRPRTTTRTLIKAGDTVTRIVLKLILENARDIALVLVSHQIVHVEDELVARAVQLAGARKSRSNLCEVVESVLRLRASQMAELEDARRALDYAERYGKNSILETLRQRVDASLQNIEERRRVTNGFVPCS